MTAWNAATGIREPRSFARHALSCNTKAISGQSRTRRPPSVAYCLRIKFVFVQLVLEIDHLNRRFLVLHQVSLSAGCFWYHRLASFIEHITATTAKERSDRIDTTAEIPAPAQGARPDCGLGAPGPDPSVFGRGVSQPRRFPDGGPVTEPSGFAR